MATVPPPPDASKAPASRIPLKAQLSLLRQRIILTFRWWFRLPIDQIKEQRIQDQINGLVALNEKSLETIQTLVKVSNNMQARLQYYERNIPRMRELKREFDAEQVRLAQAAGAASEHLRDGILVMPNNGKLVHP